MPTQIVTPVEGEPLRFYVLSRSENLPRFVDLDADEFHGILNGRCNCKGYLAVCWPRLKAGAVPSEHTRCWHIRKAREFVMDKFMRSLSDYFSRPTEPSRPGPKPYHLRPATKFPH